MLFKSEKAPLEVLEVPVVLVKSANAPLAALKLPVVLLKRVPAPVAVLLSPVFARSVPAPTAVLNFPVAVTLSEKKPTPVLYVPVVRLKSAFGPSAVLPPGYPPSGGGLTACADISNEQAISGIKNNRFRKFVDRVVVFMRRSWKIGRDVARQKESSSHRIGLNSVLLHRGHLPALSKGTGFVKFFMY